MAPRKDMMRIIRQDAGFSAKLGFGGPAASPAAKSTDAAATAATAQGALDSVTSALDAAFIASPGGDERAEDPARSTARCGTPNGEATSEPIESGPARPGGSATAVGSAARGHVVYVAVSLTTRQAALAETWATAAKCSVQFLIRRVAQGLREEVFEDWEQDGMPEIVEPRGSRGRHPTSVTLTLRPPFAAALSARHDPLGMVGLARVMGPAFRARFEAAFDDALAKAKIQSVNEGDET